MYSTEVFNAQSVFEPLHMIKEVMAVIAVSDVYHPKEVTADHHVVVGGRVHKGNPDVSEADCITAANSLNIDHSYLLQPAGSPKREERAKMP